MSPSGRSDGIAAIKLREPGIWPDDRKLAKIDAASFRLVYRVKYYEGAIRAYVADRAGIWWLDGASKSTPVLFLTGDAEHFEIVDDIYARDGATVFCRGRPIPNSHASSFTVLPDSIYFAKDRQQVYMHSHGTGLQIIPDADPETFHGLGVNQFATDRDHVFWVWDFAEVRNGTKWECGVPSRETQWERWLPEDWKKLAPNSSAEALLDLEKRYPDLRGYWWCPDYAWKPQEAVRISDTYSCVLDAVYYRGKDQEPNLIRHASAENFEPLNDCYARDRTAVYFRWRRLSDALLESFRVIGGLFARDDHGIWYNGYRVEGCDVETFEIIGPPGERSYARDSEKLYFPDLRRPGPMLGAEWLLWPIKGADPRSFEMLSPSWARDCKQVYLHGHPKKKIDAPTFRHLFRAGVSDWAADRNFLYDANGHRTIKEIEGGTFEVLNSTWGKDHKSAFCFMTQRITKNADAATFQVTDEEDCAEDKNARYTCKGGAVRRTRKK